MRKLGLFENSVISFGSKTSYSYPLVMYVFENSVISFGSKTNSIPIQH